MCAFKPQRFYNLARLRFDEVLDASVVFFVTCACQKYRPLDFFE